MKKIEHYLTKNWFWLVVNLVALLPLALLAWDYALDNLSVNPIDDFTDRTGKAAISFCWHHWPVRRPTPSSASERR